MENKDLCKLYKGEKECPEIFINQGTSLFWYAERIFVEMQDKDKIESMVHFYIECDLAGVNYDLPIHLLACIFSELCRHSEDSPENDALFFRDDVLPKYLALPQR